MRKPIIVSRYSHQPALEPHFVESPPGKPPRKFSRPSPVYGPFLAALREHPGQWAYVEVRTNGIARSVALAMRKGSWSAKRGPWTAACPPDSFEATPRGRRIYARFVGLSKSEEATA